MTVATTIGTFVAFLLVPMRSLGADNWKIAAALMGSYIGGCEYEVPSLHLNFVCANFTKSSLIRQILSWNVYITFTEKSFCPFFFRLLHCCSC